MEIGLLGPLEVTAAGEVVEIGGARLRALLVRLALGAGRTVTVEEIAETLWPQGGPADRGNAVRSLVARLRRALPDATVLRSVPNGYRLDLPPDAVDVHRFDRLARDGRRALSAGDPVAALERLHAALGLWRGPALADAPFATAYVAGLDEARLTAIEDHAEARLASGRHAHLVAELSGLAARHPLRERLQGLLLRALCAAGRKAEALAAYEGVRRRLADELGADPGPELQAAHLAMLRTVPPPPPAAGPARRSPAAPGLSAAHPGQGSFTVPGQGSPAVPGQSPPPGPGPRPAACGEGNLRAALTSFVGRQAEAGRLTDLLGEDRLVTLVGPGGAGKTRLATTVAAGIAGRVPGGVWLVELAPVTDPADVPQAVLGVLGSRETDPLLDPAGARDATSRLVRILSRVEATIVLDNCEHVVEAAARLAEELLGRCPGLRILATSREPLAITGEVLCPVPPLGVPDPGASVSEAAASPAVRLLVDRAGAVRPGFAVTDGNVAAVVEICRRLDGLPLAIELAAARLRSLTVEQLAERLDDRFRLLTGGSRTALPRHQTLRAVVAWSWDLLGDDERRLAEEIAVFPGTVTVETAERVCSPSGDTLDLLAALVDKSLLQPVEAAEPRYRMLETIREYGLERLAQTGRLAGIRAAHAACFRDLAEEAEPYLRGADQLGWIARLDAERDNMLAALHTAAGNGDADTAVRLVAALSVFWVIRGHRGESVDRLRLALDVPGQAPPERRMVAEAMYLLNTAMSGGYPRLEVMVGQFETLAAAAEAYPGHWILALLEPMLRLFTDDSVRGLAAIDRRLDHPDPWTRATLWTLRAAIRENDGDMAGMRTDMAAAIAGFREVGDRFGLSQSLSSMAEPHLAFGDLDRAIEVLQEAIELMRELDPDDDAAHERILLAGAHASKGEVERARAEFRALTRPGPREWSARNVAFARLCLGNLARYEGDLREAERQYGAAAAVIEEAPFIASQFRALIVCATGLLAVERDDLETAGRRLAEAAGWALEAKDMPVLAHIGVATAALRAGRGDPTGAAEVLGAAELVRGAPDLFDPEVSRLTGRLRRELGEEAYAAAYARGRRLSREAAVGRMTPRTAERDPAGSGLTGT
ncbi:SARP family transcriptional regulator [Planobispora takensis]|uniref:SARP family transcriptional regulator n=2 Tax=Planobispora takensis TaxID=1367882 RepID=A0A8J3T2P7_9ACTN|nr:SARP family transcriptional regulator [Planobispora takensis]